MTSPELAASAKLDAQVNLQPKASQTFLVALICLAAICVGCGTYLLDSGKSGGWFVSGLVIPIVLIGFFAWRASQSDTDLHGALPTILSSPDGSSISTDSRNMRSIVAIGGMVQLVEARNRTLLPLADGLVLNGLPVPNSADAASAQTAQINSAVQAQQAEIDAMIAGANPGTVLQVGSGNVLLPGEQPDASSDAPLG
jgi:hypothetical protein